MKKNKDKILFVLSFIVFAAIIFAFNSKTVLYTDDFRFSVSYKNFERLEFVSDAIESFKVFCVKSNDNARLANLFSMLYMLIDKSIFNIINTMLFMLLILLIYTHSFGLNKKLNSLALVIIQTFTFILVPAFGQSFLWITGSANYLLPLVLTLIVLVPYHNYFKNGIIVARNIAFKIVFGISFSILSFFTSWMHEQTALALLVASLIFVVGCKVKKLKIKSWMIGGIIGNILGLSIVVLGSINRLQNESSGQGNKILMLIKNACMITIKFGYYLMPVIVLMVSLFLLHKCRIDTNKKTLKSFFSENISSIAFLLAGLAACYAMVIVPIFAIRAWSSTVIFVIVSFSCMFCKSIGESSFFSKFFNTNNGILTVAIVVCLAFSSIVEIERVKKVYDKFMFRENYILAQKEKGNAELKVPLIVGISKYDIYYFADGFDVGENNNKSMAEYYGVDSITLGEYQ